MKPDLVDVEEGPAGLGRILDGKADDGAGMDSGSIN
jgi:hypothetical protein